MVDCPLVVETHLDNGTARVVVRGEVDISTVAGLRDALAAAVAAAPTCLVVDLGATGFIDGSAARAIAEARRDAPAGCRIVLRSPNPVARRVIELTGLDRLCLIEWSLRAS